MPESSQIVAPGPSPRTVRTASGEIVAAPEGWILLAPGDAALTRRAKAGGPTWTVQEKRGRKTFSRGIWVDAARVEQIRQELSAERAEPGYQKRLDAGAAYRQRKQDAYVEDFHAAIVAFLRFAPQHAELAEQLAAAVTAHATPVGSGTVARTERIPIERRAESAVIAWMRHQTTAYDSMKIERVKGRRREVRQELAAQSRLLLTAYREGRPAPESCPLAQALVRKPA